MMDDSVEILIEEVEKRPAIYDKTMKEYANTNIKKQLWEEVCSAVVSNWTDLEGNHKTKAGTEVQKKWRSLRSCFARELRFQKQGNSGSGAKKRRKYIYFDKLLFLLPSMENREATCNLDDQTSSGVEDEDCNETEHKEGPQKRPAGPHKETKASRKECFEESLLKVLQQETNDRMDEDVNFALSLVPTLKSLHDFQKIEAKIQIMNVLKYLKWPDVSQVPVFASNKPYERNNPQYQPGQSSVTPYLGEPYVDGAQCASGPTPNKDFTGSENNRQSHPEPRASVMTSESDENYDSNISNLSDDSEPDFLTL